MGTIHLHLMISLIDALNNFQKLHWFIMNISQFLHVKDLQEIICLKDLRKAFHAMILDLEYQVI